MEKLSLEEIEITEADLEGAFAVADIVDPRTGEVVLEGNEALSPRVLSVIQAEDSQISAFEVFFPERDEVGPMMSMTVRKDTIKSPEEALIEIYRRMRPGDPPTLDSSRNLFEGMFLNAQKYDFSRVGRLKLNTKLGLGTPLNDKILHLEDIKAVIAFLLKLRRNPLEVDDIDHLGNRRVRSVGELLENQFRIGLVRMERAIKEKMSVYQEMATAMPHDLINAKPVMASIREFFGSSPALASSWTRRTRSRRSPTSAGFPPWGRAASAASAPGSRCATCTPPTTAASAPSRPRKARTSASSRRSPASPASTSSGSSRAPTAR